MLLISWNIDSLNAALTSDSNRAQETRKVLNTIVEQNPDVIALQETKLRASGPTKKHQEILAQMFPEYEYVWRSSEEPARKSYAGVMYLYKKDYHPRAAFPKIGAPEPMDEEGRIITLEFPNYYITQVYTPNSGNGLKRLSERQVWDEKYVEYLKGLDSKKPVIASGDYNCAHTEIDFRKVNGNVTGVYSWWAQRVRTAKSNNSGWRIDYWLTSNRIADKIKRSEMIDTGERADHCPILLEIDL